MGFIQAPVMEFDNMVLTDEAAEKQLLINLADRDIICHDTIREKFGINPEIEKSKIKREVKKRGNSMPEKASPFHNPEKIHEYKKILLSGGTITPSEMGIELEEKKPGEVSKMDAQMVAKDLGRKDEVKPNGRPRNITETKKRESKTGDEARIAKSKQLLVWCAEAQSKVSEFITKAVLESTDTKNVRSLTGPQKESLEKLKANCLFNISPFSELNNDTIYVAFKERYNDTFKDDIDQILDNDVNVEQKRHSLAMLYFLNHNVF
jgi:hypothetical protein